MLLESGVLKASGRFAVPCGPAGYRLDPAEPRSAIKSATIDAFQRAKAATAAAMAVLLAEAGIDWDQIGRLCLCGAFGRHLECRQCPGGRPVAAGAPGYASSSSPTPRLRGCEMALLSPGGEA